MKFIPILESATTLWSMLISLEVSSNVLLWKISFNRSIHSDTFLMRLRGVGPCEARKIQQFAILSYKPNSVKLTDIAFPNATPFPLYGQNFGAVRVSSQIKFDYRKLKFIRNSLSTIQTQLAAMQTLTISASLTWALTSAVQTLLTSSQTTSSVSDSSTAMLKCQM